MNLINKILLSTSTIPTFLSTSCVVASNNPTQPHSPPIVDVKEELLNECKGFDGYFKYFLTSKTLNQEFNNHFNDFNNRFQIFKKHPFWTRKGYTKNDFYKPIPNNELSDVELENFEKETKESEIDSPSILMKEAMTFESNKLNYYFYKGVSFEDYAVLSTFRSYVIIKLQMEFINLYIQYQKNNSSKNFLKLYDKYLDLININNLKLVYVDSKKKNLDVFFNGDISNFNQKEVLTLASKMMTKILEQNKNIFLKKESYEPYKDEIKLLNQKIKTNLNIKEYQYLKDVVNPNTYTIEIEFYKPKEKENENEKNN